MRRWLWGGRWDLPLFVGFQFLLVAFFTAMFFDLRLEHLNPEQCSLFWLPYLASVSSLVIGLAYPPMMAKRGYWLLLLAGLGLFALSLHWIYLEGHWDLSTPGNDKPNIWWLVGWLTQFATVCLGVFWSGTLWSWFIHHPRVSRSFQFKAKTVAVAAIIAVLVYIRYRHSQQPANLLGATMSAGMVCWAVFAAVFGLWLLKLNSIRSAVAACLLFLVVGAGLTLVLTTVNHVQHFIAAIWLGGLNGLSLLQAIRVHASSPAEAADAKPLLSLSGIVALGLAIAGVVLVSQYDLHLLERERHAAGFRDAKRLRALENQDSFVGRFDTSPAAHSWIGELRVSAEPSETVFAGIVFETFRLDELVIRGIRPGTPLHDLDAGTARLIRLQGEMSVSQLESIRNRNTILLEKVQVPGLGRFSQSREGRHVVSFAPEQPGQIATLIQAYLAHQRLQIIRPMFDANDIAALCSKPHYGLSIDYGSLEPTIANAPYRRGLIQAFLDVPVRARTPPNEQWFQCKADHVRALLCARSRTFHQRPLIDLESIDNDIRQTLVDCGFVFDQRPDPQNIRSLYIPGIEYFNDDWLRAVPELEVLSLDGSWTSHRLGILGSPLLTPNAVFDVSQLARLDNLKQVFFPQHYIDCRGIPALLKNNKLKTLRINADWMAPVPNPQLEFLDCWLPEWATRGLRPSVGGAQLLGKMVPGFPNLKRLRLFTRDVKQTQAQLDLYVFTSNSEWLKQLDIEVVDLNAVSNGERPTEIPQGFRDHLRRLRDRLRATYRLAADPLESSDN